MTPYKKRAKAGWCCGKGCKKDSNRSERTYAKEEIKESLEDYEKPEDTRPPHRLPVKSSFAVFLADFKVRLGL